MPSKSNFQSRSEEETAAIAAQLADRLRGQNVLFFGDLGAGKTTFIRALAGKLGVPEKVKSPTFVIEKNYSLPSGKALHHLDLYRFDSLDTKFAAYLSELFQSSSTVLIEWAERLNSKDLPAGRIEIHFRELGAEEREIIFLMFIDLKKTSWCKDQMK